MKTAYGKLSALIALLIACPCAMAGEAVNYEISSYVLYMTIQPDGDVRVREEVIYNNPSAYTGLTLNVISVPSYPMGI